MPTNRGFSLIEVLVSLLIVSSMLVLFQGVLRNSVLVKTARNQEIALAIARSEIESLRIGGYTVLPLSGSFSDSLLSELPPGATATLSVTTYNAKTKKVEVSVLWTDSGSPNPNTVSLSTLITEIGGLP
jgi:prepilin-type N-terminal cleavage/methylation domain-containing protein